MLNYKHETYKLSYLYLSVASFNIADVFCDHKFFFLIVAILELWLIQRYINCEQFFLYNI